MSKNSEELLNISFEKAKSQQTVQIKSETSVKRKNRRQVFQNRYENQEIETQTHVTKAVVREQNAQ